MKKPFTMALFMLLVVMWGVPLFPTTTALAQNKISNFFVSNLEGKRFYSKKQKKSFVISFFFVDCVPCKKEIPVLYQLMSEKYKDHSLLFIDPIADDSTTYVKEFAAQLKVPLAHFYRDPLGRMAKRFFKGQFIFPTIVGIKDLQIGVRELGLENGALERIIKFLDQ